MTSRAKMAAEILLNPENGPYFPLLFWFPEAQVFGFSWFGVIARDIAVKILVYVSWFTRSGGFPWGSLL